MKNTFSTLMIFGLSIACFIEGASNPAFVTDYSYNNTVWSIDLNDLSLPAVSIITNIPAPDCIAFTPDATTGFITSFHSPADVYTFPLNGPFPIAATPLELTYLSSTLNYITGIALSKDGKTVFVASDDSSNGIYSFPVEGPYIATKLNAAPTTTPISAPLLLAISGDTMYIADYDSGNIYSSPVNNFIYDATLIQSGLAYPTGLAVSKDGYLYFSLQSSGNIYRVPLSNPTAIPVQVANGTSANGANGFSDGFIISNDSQTIYITSLNSMSPAGVYTCPTDPSGYPYTPTFQSGLNLPDGAIAIGIPAIPINPPSTISGSQNINDFGLVYELYNLIKWGASSSIGVSGYYVYKNGIRLASLSPNTLFYADNNIQKGVISSYSVTSFDANGNESAPLNVSIGG